jgi:hypothetical protein
VRVAPALNGHPRVPSAFLFTLREEARVVMRKKRPLPSIAIARVHGTPTGVETPEPAGENDETPLNARLNPLSISTSRPETFVSVVESRLQRERTASSALEWLTDRGCEQGQLCMLLVIVVEAYIQDLAVRPFKAKKWSPVMDGVEVPRAEHGRVRGTDERGLKNFAKRLRRTADELERLQRFRPVGWLRRVDEVSGEVSVEMLTTVPASMRSSAEAIEDSLEAKAFDHEGDLIRYVREETHRPQFGPLSQLLTVLSRRRIREIPLPSHNLDAHFSPGALERRDRTRAGKHGSREAQ